MSEATFFVGLLAALVLIPLMLRTHWQTGFRLWPTPAASWQSKTFWTLFRLLNVATVLNAVLAVAYSSSGALGLPVELRAIAFVVLVVALYLYGLALLSLGKKNTYCDRDGLMTHGIYRWTRNPQYATIIPFYIALAICADHSATYMLVAAMCSVYYLMAIVEEPWLTEAYGSAYQSYCRRVPRFFNFHRAAIWVQAQIRALVRRVPSGG